MTNELINQKDSVPIEIFPSVVNSNSASLANSLDKDCYFIGTYEEADGYLHDNEYIRKGYRIHFTTVKRIFKSLLMCHNESTNIWSHIFGMILFITFIGYIFIILVPGKFFVGYYLNVVSGNTTHTVEETDKTYGPTLSVYSKSENDTKYVEGITSLLSNYVKSFA